MVALAGFGFSAAAELTVTPWAIGFWAAAALAAVTVISTMLWPQHVALDFKVQTPEPLAVDPNILKLTLRVKNLKRTGMFEARGVTTVSNVSRPDYHVGNLAWEGRGEPTVRIWSGGLFDLYLARVDVPRRVVRFIGPASVYSEDRGQTRGEELQPTADHVDFEMEVRDTSRDRGVTKRVRIDFDEESNYPKLTVSDP
jgi:hypothetical protein